MKKPTKVADYTRKSLRIPDDLYAEIVAAAEGNARTINAEIVARLQERSDADKFGKLSREIADIKSIELEILGLVRKR